MDLKALLARKFAPLTVAYEAKDTILYALGVGAGADPMDRTQLPFVYENGLKIIPAQASVIAYPGPWMTEPEIGINYLKVLHGEQGVYFERPLKPAARVRGEYEVLAVDDKGPGKAAVMFFEKRILDADDGGVIARVHSTYFLRGDGGCGSWGNVPAAPAPLPERTPDRVIETATIPRQALIYRLSGDLNPVHIDPGVAEKAGFAKPILHGLGTFGVVALQMVQHLCDGDPDRMVQMFARFSKPVFPGDTIRLDLFEEANGWRFRALALERGEVVLDRGVARFK